MTSAIETIISDLNSPGFMPDQYRLFGRAIIELNDKIAPDPDSRNWAHELAVTSVILEKCLATALRGDWKDAPFGMDADDAKIWHAGRAEAFRHALEMLPSTDAPKLKKG